MNVREICESTESVIAGNGSVPQNALRRAAGLPEIEGGAGAEAMRENYAEQMDALGYNADGNPKEETQELRIMPLICLRCKKDIPLTVPTFREISYTHYSYCEECLRAGLLALRYQEAENEKARIRREFETPEGMRPLPWETPETPQKIVVSNAVDVLSIQTELLAIREALTEIKKAVKGET